jgi:hypothetical protein
MARTLEEVAEVERLYAAYVALHNLPVDPLASPHYEAVRDAHIAWLKAEARVWGVRNSALIMVLYGAV